MRTRKRSPKSVRALRLAPELVVAVQMEADRLGISFSELARRALVQVITNVTGIKPKRKRRKKAA